MSDVPRRPDASRKSDSFVRYLLRSELGSLLMLLLALLLIVVFFAVADRMRGGAGFSTIRNVRVVLAQTSTIAVAALGMTLIIIAGGIDLSAGTALALCATVMAVALKSEYSVPMVLLLTVGCGCLCGMVNGLLISLLRVVPFIVTLGTLTIYLGAGKIIADESTVFPPRDAIPYWLQNLCTTRPPDTGFGFCANGLGFGIIISWGVVFAFFLALLVLAILRYTVFGRYVFALGSNEATARLCGVPIVRTKIAVYTLAGLFVGLAGMYHFSVLKIGNPTDGPGMELDIIAAVVIGGGSLSGGRGSVLGTLTGAAVMAVIRSGCDQLEVPGPYQDVIIGAIIIVAVALDQLRQRRLAT